MSLTLNKVKNSAFLANKAYDNKTKLNKEAEKMVEQSKSRANRTNRRNSATRA